MPTEHRLTSRSHKDCDGFTAKKIEPIKVILDSNALFVPLEFKMDIFEELRRLLNRNVEFILLSPVKHELELLAAEDAPKIRRQAIFALRLAEKCKFVPVEDQKSNRQTMLLFGLRKTGIHLCLQMIDSLKKRLRDISVPVIYVRQKSRLDIDGLIS